MAVATAASLWSARFANRVNNRTVGLVAGVILTAMGALLIVLHYWEYISRLPLALEILRCFGRYLLFIVPTALLLIILNYTLKIPRVLFRKLLPFAYPKKTWEGSGSMAAVSAAVDFAAMSIMTANHWYVRLLSAVVTSICGAYAELVTRDGNDTVTVPVVNAVILLAFQVIS